MTKSVVTCVVFDKGHGGGFKGGQPSILPFWKVRIRKVGFNFIFHILQVVIATSGTSSLQYKLKFDKEEKSGTISLL